ncbi:MAG TPA: hypothetical protein VFV34_01955 [Blastocatellia bacterium]|nr:hypothetical protein [Blastocatellia bacterium]
MSRNKSRYSVLNPRGRHTRDVEPLPLAPRPASLNGKTVYFVDVGFGGGYEFLEQTQGWFSRKMPSVKTVLVRKPGNMLMDTPDFWVELKEKSDGVVFGVGG